MTSLLLLALQLQATPSEPLSLTDILGLAAAGAQADIIAREVSNRGISFSPTAENLQILRGTSAGWADTLLKNAKVFSPAGAAPSTPEARLLTDLARCDKLNHSQSTPFSSEAERACKAALASSPQNPFVMMAVGTSLSGQLKRKEAAVFFRQALTFKPRLAFAHVMLADALIAGDSGGSPSPSDYDEGLLEGIRALRLERNDRFAMALFGFGFGDGGVPDHAITALQRESARNPNDAVPHFVLGIAHVEKWNELNHFQRAITELREAIQLDPTNAEYHSYLGGILNDSGDLVGALTEFDSARKLDPANEDFHKSYEDIANKLKKN